MLPGCDLENAIARGNELRKLVAATPVAALNSEKEITVSMGVAVSEGGGTDAAQALLSCADAGLYAAKENGRNRVEHFGSKPKKKTVRRTQKS